MVLLWYSTLICYCASTACRWTVATLLVFQKHARWLLWPRYCCAPLWARRDEQIRSELPVKQTRLQRSPCALRAPPTGYSEPDAETLDAAGRARGAMAALYDRYAGLFLHTNAAFLCERAHAEAPSSQTLEALASCYLRQGAAHRAYATLRGQTLEPHGRYLLALACHRLDKDAEAEAALLPDRAARAAGPRESAQLLRSKASPVPHGAAGLYVLGSICEKGNRANHAIAYYELALEKDALMWVAYDALCRLGADVDPQHTFRRDAPHSLKNETVVDPPTASKDENAPPQRTPRGPRVLEPTPPSAPSTHRPKALSFASTPASTPLERPRAKVPRTASSDRGFAPYRNEVPSSLPGALLDVLRILGSARRDLAASRTDASLKALHSLPARHFDTGWAQHLRGRAHFEKADYDACVNALQSMRRCEPHRLEGLELLSTALWHLKDDVQLCYLARDAVRRDPRSPEAWCAAGNCLSLQKEHDAAIRCFHRAIAVAPRFAYAYTLCGHEYVANEAFEKAVAMYRHAMRCDLGVPRRCLHTMRRLQERMVSFPILRLFRAGSTGGTIMRGTAWERSTTARRSTPWRNTTSSEL